LYGSRVWQIDMQSPESYTGGMEVHFTPDQQARLIQFASQLGKDAEQVVRDAVDHLLNDARYVEEVRKGFASLDRGEFVEHEEVGSRINRLLSP
jgi:predicted transcriptional regulator